jgi:L-ascorbate metabolism protein UlaG (beta-lactamase superfamily)
MWRADSEWGGSDVLGVVKQAAGLLRYQANKARHEREDLAALSELQTVPLELPAGLEIEWLGVAGYRLTYQDHTLLLDPFVSRFPLRETLLRKPVLPDQARIAALRAPGTVVGIACGHAHFDHALDTPAFARRFGCTVYGSRSLVSLMRLHGLGEQALEAQPYRRYELGPFELSFTPSAHSKLVFGLRVPMDGDITARSVHQLTTGAYKCGQTWAIRVAVAGAVIYHQGSADIIEQAVRDHDVDIFLTGIAGRHVTPRYWERTLPLLRPKVVVPMHYDDFYTPIEDPMTFVPLAHLAAIPDELRAVSRDVAVVALPRLTPIHG